MRKKIYDKNITDNNFGAFDKCSIINTGKAIKFNFAGGSSYCVPIEYFLSWYTEPHYIFKNGKWIEWNSLKHKIVGSKKTFFVKQKRIMSKHAVKVYLNNKTSYVVPWDTVLMSCEEMYEHFGGLTKTSIKITNQFIGNNKKGCRCN